MRNLIDSQWVSLDIETIADDTVPEEARPLPKRDARWTEATWQAKVQEFLSSPDGRQKKMATSPMYASVAYTVLFDGVQPVHFSTENQSETDVVRSVWDILLGGPEPKGIVTKFGKGFDMPVLLARACLLDVMTPLDAQLARKIYLAKYRTEDTHVDLQDCPELGGLKLEELALRLYGNGKLHDGSEVAGMVERGEWAELGEYCEDDTRLAWRIAQQFHLLPMVDRSNPNKTREG